MGHSPKRVLAWGPRRDTRPAGERRSGGAFGGCLSHRDSDPTWSKARDDAYAQKERPAGEAYRSSPCGDSATPPGDQKLSPARQMNSLRLCKRPRRQATTNQPNKIHKSPICKNPLRVHVRAGLRRGVCTWARARGSPTKIVPKGTRKNGAVPPGSAGQKQENKNFSKKFAQTGRNLPPRLRIILVEGFATRKRPPIPPKFAFCTEMTHQGETI